MEMMEATVVGGMNERGIEKVRRPYAGMGEVVLRVIGPLLTLMQSGRFDPTPLITHWFSLDGLTQNYQLFCGRLDGVLEVAIEP